MKLALFGAGVALLAIAAHKLAASYAPAGLLGTAISYAAPIGVGALAGIVIHAI